MQYTNDLSTLDNETLMFMYLIVNLPTGHIKDYYATSKSSHDHRRADWMTTAKSHNIWRIVSDEVFKRGIDTSDMSVKVTRTVTNKEFI